MKNIAFSALMAAGCLYSGQASADTCIGTCGSGSPNGVVTSPPAFGPGYQYISTVGGLSGAGQIPGVAGGTIGSEFLTSVFTATTGDSLNFYFNYVTSDGSGSFTDYAFAELLNNGIHAAWLFTGRTTPSGNTSPGFGLPANDSVLTPATTAIVSGAPVWSQLGGSSGSCYAAGCGYTGWIGSQYTLAGAGAYQLRFGVTNVGDTAYQSGLAFAGVTINNVPVGAVPEPATWAMMLLGFGLVGGVMRRKIRQSEINFTARVRALSEL
ncbi:NF038132 family protein [Sphingomonas qilianensis]|uniref:NF038132 family protein n=1 Tax=Sphingomonas qilianensis TaxID=1736690 RepID=A0ABU9XUR5_9SPHN